MKLLQSAMIAQTLYLDTVSFRFLGIAAASGGGRVCVPTAGYANANDLELYNRYWLA